MAAQSSESIQAHKKKKSHSFRGVRFRKWGGYGAEIRVPKSKKKIWLGSFSTVEQAARAYDAAAYCLKGPDSYFNFSDSPPNNIEPVVIDSADAIRAVSRAYAMQLDSVRETVITAAGSEIDGHIISAAEQTPNNNIGDDQRTDQSFG